MIFDFLSAVFLGGALFKDAYDKTASDRHAKEHLDYMNRELARAREDAQRELDDMKKRGVHYDQNLQGRFLRLYIACSQYYIDPTIVKIEPFTNKDGTINKNYKAYYYHPCKRGQEADPNVADFPSDTLLAYRYEKCREDFEKINGIVWDFDFERRRFSMIRECIKSTPDAKLLLFSSIYNHESLKPPMEGDLYNFFDLYEEPDAFRINQAVSKRRDQLCGLSL